MPTTAIIIYLAGLALGLTMVSFPALSGILKEMQGLSDAQYGAIFLPQVAFAVIGSLLSGSLAHRLGLARLTALGLLVTGLSQLCLLAGGASHYGLLLLGTTFMGLGFGLLSAPINSYPAWFFPRLRGSALVAMHTLIGLGLALGPIVLVQAQQWGDWQAYPQLMLALNSLLASLAIFLPAISGATTSAQAGAPGPLWRNPAFMVFGAIAVLYAFAEGTFANWAVIYLIDQQIEAAAAGYALSAFWLALALGRLGVAALVAQVSPVLIWRSLPLGMVAVFLALPSVHDLTTGIGLFALAGLACSAVFPLTIELASQRFLAYGAQVGALMTAALMLGVGLGSYTIGLLRELTTLEMLYAISALYPATLWLLTWVAMPRR